MTVVEHVKVEVYMKREGIVGGRRRRGKRVWARCEQGYKWHANVGNKRNDNWGTLEYAKPVSLFLIGRHGFF